MDFTLRIVTDGRNATVSVSGIGSAGENAEALRKKIDEAVCTALGLAEPAESDFREPPEAPAGAGALPEGAHEAPARTYRAPETQETGDAGGVLIDMEDAVITGDRGRETVNAERRANSAAKIRPEARAEAVRELFCEASMCPGSEKEAALVRTAEEWGRTA